MSGARELAAAVRAGERSARTVTEEALAAVAAGDGEVHAFLTVMGDEALAQADAVDAAVAQGRDPGPLAGVPVALKDNLCTRGIPTTCGSRILDGWRPPYDATVVELLRAAGAVALGKTNMDEFAMGSSTENSAFGPTRNPRGLDRVPGGSSGGSAAAVAAGFTPLGLGSDTGGSIRQPAALCGVVGLKPTYGSVSRYGLVAFASSLDQIGPFAANVEDAALLFDAVAAHDPRDSTSLPGVHPTTLEAVRAGADHVRVGLCPDLIEGCAPDVASRVYEAAEALSAAGAKVDEVRVPEFAYGLSAYYLIAPAEASSNLARYDGVRYGLRVEADDAAQRGGLADRPPGVGSERERDEASGHRGGGATAAASRHPLNAVRVARGPEGGVLRRAAHGELVHVGLAQRDRPGGAQELHHCGVVGRPPAFEDLRGTGGRDTPGAQVVLQRDRHAGQWAGVLTPGYGGIDRIGLRQRLVAQDLQEGVELPVATRHGCQRGLGHLARRTFLGPDRGRHLTRAAHAGSLPMRGTRKRSSSTAGAAASTSARSRQGCGSSGRSTFSTGSG